jgi:protein TonB
MAMLRTQLQNLDHQKQYYASQETGSEKLKMLKTRIKDLQRQLERASEVYTPENPHIKRMQAQIAAWERERDVERAQDPLNQKMLLDLDDSMALVQAQMEKLNLSMDQKLKQVQELNRTITQYQQRSESAPDLEMRYAELMRSLGKARSQVEQLANQPAAATTGPGLISRRDPEYTPEARKASLQGKVELSVAVGADGVPGDIQVTHGLDAGLDQKAVECVKSWRFRPATRNGEAVTAFVIVEVPFRLQ